MAGDGDVPKKLAVSEASLKRAREATAAASTVAAAATVEVAEEPAGTAPFLENFILRPHIRSQLSKNHLSQYRRVYEIPPSFRLRLPLQGESSKCFLKNSICLFLDTFTLGLRLPLAEPIADLMNHVGCVPAMFSPNSLPLLLAVHSAFEQVGLPWSIPNFFSLYSTNMADEFLSFKSRYINKFSVLGFPSSHPKWRSKYFFVSNPEGFPFDITPQVLAGDVFKAPPTMDPAIAEYIETPRQLHTRDLVPPFINPSGSVKADVAPRGSTPRAKAKNSGGEGGSTEAPQKGSTHKRVNEMSTSQTAPEKRSDSPRPGACKVGKSNAGSSAGEASRRSSEPKTVSLLSDDEGEEDGGPEGPAGEERLPAPVPTDGRPLLWYSEMGVAAIKRFHQRPTQAMGGKLSNFPLQVGDAVRSRSDLSVRHKWARDEVPHRVMEHGLDAFNSMYYTCQLYSIATKEVARLEAENRKAVETAKVAENLWLALGKRAESLEADVDRLAGSNSNLIKERDQFRDEVGMLRAQLETEASTSKAQAEAAAQVQIDSLQATVTSLRTERKSEAAALEAATEKMKQIEEAADKDGKELVELRRKVGNPRALGLLYRGSDEHGEEMEHYLAEGFKMTQEYMLRDAIKDGMSIDDVRRLVTDLDYDIVKDADLAAGSSTEEEGEDEEGANST